MSTLEHTRLHESKFTTHRNTTVAYICTFTHTTDSLSQKTPFFPRTRRESMYCCRPPPSSPPASVVSSTLDVADTFSFELKVKCPLIENMATGSIEVTTVPTSVYDNNEEGRTQSYSRLMTFHCRGPDYFESATSPDGCTFDNLSTGKYVLTIENDVHCKTMTLDIVANLERGVVVEGYRVVSPTTSLSEDGSVEVVGRNFDDVSFAWSNGMVTKGPLLENVSCGTYFAVPFSEHGFSPTYVCLCGPIVVDVDMSRWN